MMIQTGKTSSGQTLLQIVLAVAATLGALAPVVGKEVSQSPASDSDRLEPRGQPGSSALLADESYLISPDDELEIEVMDVPQISRTYRVSPGGSITVSLLPRPVTAAGLTPDRLSQVISDELRASGMVTNAHVTVQVKQSRAHSISIGGAVKRPQNYPLYTKMTLLDALSQAEGLAEDAGSIVLVTRGEIALHMAPAETAGKAQAGPASDPRKITVDLRKLVEDGDPNSNVELYPGDRVTVPRAGIIYVVGAVNRAGGFPLQHDRVGMTVLKAVALAENLKSTAMPKKAVIIRKDPQVAGKGEEIPVDLKKILGGHSPDRPLLANDILFVPDSAGKKAFVKAGEAAAQAAALMVYRIP